METTEFEKLMSEAPERADETKINFEPDADREPETPPASAQADGEGLEEPKTVKMSVAQFGATVTGIYTAVSDFVYKRIKGTDTAPAWTETERENLNNAMLPVLEQYNVTLTPATNLIITIAVIEAMRYSHPAMIAQREGGENE